MRALHPGEREMKAIAQIAMVAVVGAAWTVGARAHDDEVLFNRVYLDAQAERSIPNDEMQVLLVSEHQGVQPQGISERVNADMEWALDQARRYRDVEVRTLGYQTVPVYEKRVIASWRASQEVQLSSQSIARLTELVGKLQERLHVRQMQFRPTQQTRDQYLDELIDQALAAFKRRAALVGKQMDGKEYRIVELHINTGAGHPPVVFAERAMMRAMEGSIEPAVEAGTSLLTVTVTGSVQFY